MIWAKYANGKTVRGTAIVSIDQQRYSDCEDLIENESVDTIASKTISLDGDTETIEFDIENDLNIDRDSIKHERCRELVMRVKVTETDTKFTQLNVKQFNIHKDTYIINCDRSFCQITKSTNLQVYFLPQMYRVYL